MKSGDLKPLIVAYCVDHQTAISNQFQPPLTSNQFQECLKVKNWKRIGKEGTRRITRTFDCRPFDDQLRAEVVTEGETIISLIVQGE